MSYVMWHFKVEDYERWKAVFDSDPLDRGANGSKGGMVLRSASDPNEVMILLEWDEASLDKLKGLTQSPGFQEVQKKSGYTAPPSIYILEVVDKPSS